MKTCVVLGVLWLTFVLGLTFTAPRRTEGCAPVPPRNTPVAIADESAIIIWDDANKMQHFIRRASFKTEAQDFGFLVPTPTQPELGESSDEAFDVLAKITEPKVVKQPRPSSGGCGIGCGVGSKAPSDKSSVEVLDQKRIAGQDVVVLKAEDAADLTKWLADHGYEFSPTLKDWLQPYLDKKWIITASKIAREGVMEKEPEKQVLDAKIAQVDKKESKQGEPLKPKEPKKVGSTTVRMSFNCDKPFFPYSEPFDQREKKGTAPRRMLRVFFLGTEKVQGKLGDKGEKWPGYAMWANKIEQTDREKVLNLIKLPKETGPASWWLTEFEDTSSPRPGADDLFFSRAEDQAPLERKPHIQYVSTTLPDCLITYVLTACVVVPGVIRASRRRKL